MSISIPQLKERLVEGVKEFRANLAAALRNPGRAWAIFFVLGTMFCAMGAVVGVGLMIVMPKVHHAEGHAASEGAAQAGEHAESGGEHAEASAATPGFLAEALPKSVRDRQDGIPEEDKDLVEKPKAERDLASVMKEAPAPVPYNPFFEISEIMASTNDSGSKLGRVAMTVVFEGATGSTLFELERRKGELQYLLASLLSEKGRDELAERPGREKLKREIFREVNYLLRDGKVTDVLLTDFTMK